jgi:poly-gamma-glutamate synthesis protein (capsule biosynthesis protein)
MTYRAILTLVLFLYCSVCFSACDGPLYRPQYPERTLFEPALRTASGSQILRLRAGGLTVPHHLAAADLIARAFAVVQPEAFDKIIILFPDHFRRSQRPFATTTRSFSTVFGPVCTNAADAQQLLRQSKLVEASDLFERDHGIGAILPFVRHFLPSIPIVPIAVTIRSRRAQWDLLLDALAPIVTPRTLIVQSTDFSHYLRATEAAINDQTTLNVIAASDMDNVAKLSQPAYLDSAGSQYIQMRLQAQRKAHPIVLFNRNSQSYSKEHEAETTSYVVQIYPRDPVDTVLPKLPGSRVLCFAGDFFVGRHVAPLLRRDDVARKVRDRLHNVLRGCPLIVNLEGAFGLDTPDPRARKLVMDGALAIRWLKQLNVIAVSLANNHAFDLGPDGYNRTIAALKHEGIRVLEHGDVTDLGDIRIVSLSDLDNTRDPGSERITPDTVSAILRAPAAPPLIAFLHWGEEFVTEPGPREQELARSLANAAVSLVVGAHPHARSKQLQSVRGESLMAYSLGNFIFDQPQESASGAILELRLFEQGTFFARLIAIPNVYKDAIGSRR